MRYFTPSPGIWLLTAQFHIRSLLGGATLRSLGKSEANEILLSSFDVARGQVDRDNVNKLCGKAKTGQKI